MTDFTAMGAGRVTPFPVAIVTPDAGAELPPVAMTLKRGFDLVFAVCALLALLPLLLLVCCGVKLSSPGPVLFVQTRTGRFGRPFPIFKFRTMYFDKCDATGVTQTVNLDPRVTSVGVLLRRTNIDELPQLINVLRGEMSIVGPRPHVPGMLAAGVLYEELVPEYHLRHLVRPGLTGLAQSSGYRGPTVDSSAATARIQLDLEYIRSISLIGDLQIILRTLVSEIKRGSGC